MITGLANGAMAVLTGIGYPGIAAIVGLESAGVPLPGETALLAASYLAATGHLSLPLVISSAALGAIAGDSLGYLAGRRGGRRLLERYGRYVRLSPKRLQRADAYFERRGMATVFLGRFFPLLRITAGPLAGASKMPYRKFLLANATGAVTWATVMGTLAFYLGKPVAAVLGSLGGWALLIFVALVVARFALVRFLPHLRRRVSSTHPESNALVEKA
jgi:membrane protein DedA with SNARE-associated domain